MNISSIAVLNPVEAVDGRQWNIKRPFEDVAKKLIRSSPFKRTQPSPIKETSSSSSPSSGRKNFVDLSEQRHTSQSNWLSGSITATRQGLNQHSRDSLDLPVISQQGNHQQQESESIQPIGWDVKMIVDPDRPSVMDFVDDPNNLPKMFYLESIYPAVRESDTYLEALEHSRLPCQMVQDSFDCFDANLYYPPEPLDQFHSLQQDNRNQNSPNNFRPTPNNVRPSSNNVRPTSNNFRPTSNNNRVFPTLVISQPLSRPPLLSYFKLFRRRESIGLEIDR